VVTVGASFRLGFGRCPLRGGFPGVSFGEGCSVEIRFVVDDDYGSEILRTQFCCAKNVVKQPARGMYNKQ
jgi:hypothetical protein